MVFWGMIDSRFTHIILVLWGFNHGFMCVSDACGIWQLSACSKASMCYLEYRLCKPRHGSGVYCTGKAAICIAKICEVFFLCRNLFLVGGFTHDFYFPFHIWDVILPIDELIFFRGVGIPPTSFCCEAFCGTGISASVECCISLAQGVAAKLGHTHRSTCWFYVSGFNKCFCGVCLELYGKIAIKYMAI